MTKVCVVWYGTYVPSPPRVIRTVHVPDAKQETFVPEAVHIVTVPGVTGTVIVVVESVPPPG